MTLSDLLQERDDLLKVYLNPLKVTQVLAEIFNMADGMKKPGVQFYPTLTGLNQVPSLFDIEKDLNDRYLPCYEPWSIVRVTAYGDMYPCLPFRIGNIRECSPKDLWNSVRYKAFRQWLKKAVLRNACERCCNLTLRTGAA